MQLPDASNPFPSTELSSVTAFSTKLPMWLQMRPASELFSSIVSKFWRILKNGMECSVFKVYKERTVNNVWWIFIKTIYPMWIGIHSLVPRPLTSLGMRLRYSKSALCTKIISPCTFTLILSTFCSSAWNKLMWDSMSTPPGSCADRCSWSWSCQFLNTQICPRRLSLLVCLKRTVGRWY